MTIDKLLLGKLFTNCYIITDEKTGKSAIVDPAGESKKIINYIKENDLNVEYIIITHAHIDHIVALDDVKEFTKAKVIISKTDNEALNNDAFNLALFFGFPSPKTTSDITVKDQDEIMLGETKLKFIMTPGHNKGSMCILSGDDLISGDTLFCQAIGRCDHYGGDFNQITQSIKKLYLLPDETRVYPGHGDNTTIGFEKRHNPFVKDDNI